MYPAGHGESLKLDSVKGAKTRFAFQKVNAGPNSKDRLNRRDDSRMDSDCTEIILISGYVSLLKGNDSSE